MISISISIPCAEVVTLLKEGMHYSVDLEILTGVVNSVLLLLFIRIDLTLVTTKIGVRTIN